LNVNFRGCEQSFWLGLFLCQCASVPSLRHLFFFFDLGATPLVSFCDRLVRKVCIFPHRDFTPTSFLFTSVTLATLLLYPAVVLARSMVLCPEGPSAPVLGSWFSPFFFPSGRLRVFLLYVSQPCHGQIFKRSPLACHFLVKCRRCFRVLFCAFSCFSYRLVQPFLFLLCLLGLFPCRSCLALGPPFVFSLRSVGRRPPATVCFDAFYSGSPPFRPAFHLPPSIASHTLIPRFALA